MTVKSNSTMDFEVYLKLTESEARALRAIVCYGAKEFLRTFYEHLGKHYLQDHEKGLISLFDSVEKEIPAHLKRIDKARNVFQELNPNLNPTPSNG